MGFVNSHRISTPGIHGLMSNRSFSEKKIQCDSENWPPLLIGYNFSLILKKFCPIVQHGEKCGLVISSFCEQLKTDVKTIGMIIKADKDFMPFVFFI